MDSGGNVGIGTTSPSSILSLGGDAARTFGMERHTTANTAGNNLTVSAGGATSGATDKSGGTLVLSGGTATGTGTSQIQFQTAAAGSTGTADNAPATRMTIDGGGYVGIGTTAPGAALDISAGYTIVAGADNTSNIARTRTDSTNKAMRFGVVHYLNTQSPATVLTASSSNTANNVTIGGGTAFMNAATEIVFNTASNTTTVSGTERMRINASGNVGIGTTSPGSALDVKGTLRLSGSTSGYVGLAPAAAAGSTTYTLPSADGTSGQMLSTDGSGTLSWASPSGTATALPFSGLTAATATNSIDNTDYAQTWAWNTLAGASALTLSSTSTAAASNTQTILNIALSGANATSTQTTYGAQIANTHTGTASTNVGLSVSASGGTNNYGLLVPSGRVGIGTTTPGQPLAVWGAANIDGSVRGIVALVDTTSAAQGTGAGINFGGYTNGATMSAGFAGINGIKESAVAGENAGALTLSTRPNSGAITERFRINSAGNVGIGTTSPGSALDVKGTLRLSGSTSGYVGLAPAAAAGSTTYTLPSADGTSGQMLSTDGSGTLSWASPSGTATALPFSGLTAATATNSIDNTNYAQTWAWNTLAGASALTLSSTSTAAAGNAQTILNIALSGANATSTQTTYGAQIANTHTGTSSTNVGLSVSASGGTNNYGLLVPSGNVGIGTTAPTGILQVVGGNQKILLSSTSYSWGQLQLGNPTSNAESSMAFVSGVSSFGNTPVSTNGNTNVWILGAGTYSTAGNQFNIGNKAHSTRVQTHWL